MIQIERSSGVLLHITSLPNWAAEPDGAAPLDFSIGDLGPSAHRFLEFLAEAGQSVWQFLPLGPTVHGNSPYSCYSAFAGNYLMISPWLLVEQGLLEERDLRRLASEHFVSGRVDHCDFARAADLKAKILEQAYERWRLNTACALVDEFEEFCVRQRWWLDDFALFAAVMKHCRTDDWTEWESSLANRDSRAMGDWKERLSREVEYEQYVQFVFHTQWQSLKDRATSLGIRLFGDMPIFVAHGSSDVWAHQDSFFLDKKGRPSKVAGVPPNYFSKTGQLWGNPLYDWQQLKSCGYAWWVHRLQAAFESFDLLRIDHFRGFESYWAVPASARTAISGTWEAGPGTAPFDAAQKQLGELPIIAEDLGLITESVHALRDQLGFPGMRVLQFGFDDEKDYYHRPANYPEHSVAYTGTHDNQTIVSWYREGMANPTRTVLLDPLLEPLDNRMDLHWKLISLVMESASQLAILPMQDILGLTEEARMNLPGQAEGNWSWRLDAGKLDQALAQQLKQITRAANR